MGVPVPPEASNPSVTHYPASDSLVGEISAIDYVIPAGTEQKVIDFFRNSMPVAGSYRAFTWCKEQNFKTPEPLTAFLWADGSKLLMITVHTRMLSLSLGDTSEDDCTGN